MKRDRYTQSILILLAFTTLTGCIEQFPKANNLNLQKSKMESLWIPNAFNFEMHESIPIQVSFENTNSRMSENEAIQFAIFGLDEAGEMHNLQIGFTWLTDGIFTSITKPLHIEQLFLNTKYLGNSRFFELTNDILLLDYTNLIVEDSLFFTSNGRTSSNPNCTSFLGNATKITCKNNSVLIKSSSSFLYVDVEFTDGHVQRFLPNETGILNSNQNQWEFSGSLGSYSLSQAHRFRVYADCKTSPHQVSEEMATFVNPCGSLNNDLDLDGVPDNYDVSPNDPSVASISYFPARDRYATFAFEDMWPYKGDYDFNDLVVSHQATVYTNATHQVTKVDYLFKVRAIGAIFDNDLCINFSDAQHQLNLDQIIPATIGYQLIPLTGKTEIRFSHIREVFGREGFINTDTTKNYFEPVTISFTALFNGTVNSEDFEIDEYLRINQEEGREVHKPGRSFTSLADHSFFGIAADDTRPNEGKLYKSKTNLPWVLEIPTEWEYPKEHSEIIEGYPNFKDFAQGRKNSPWYTDDTGNKIHKHLYRKNR